jgi:LacI family transcriptional regulator
VTLATIAQAAGVSVPTVSRVLNGDADVAEATRVRIEGLLDDFGYQGRNRQRAGSAELVYAVYPRIDTAWQLEHIRGMEDVMREAGMALVVSTLERGAAGRNEVLRRAQTGQAAGAILVAGSGDTQLGVALDRLKVPVVAVDPSARSAGRVPTIGAANWLGARTATEHLISLGHRRIAMITGSHGGLLCSRARVDGYRAALDEAGITEDPRLIKHGEFDYHSGVAAGCLLIDLADRPTAIFAASDYLALGAYEAARRRRLSIPGDLSVIGFDDLPVARWASPPLTTVRQPLEEMGRLAARTVLNLARGRSLDTPTLELSTRLMERGSTASPAPSRPERSS